MGAAAQAFQAASRAAAAYVEAAGIESIPGAGTERAKVADTAKHLGQGAAVATAVVATAAAATAAAAANAAAAAAANLAVAAVAVLRAEVRRAACFRWSVDRGGLLLARGKSHVWRGDRRDGRETCDSL